MKNLFLVLFALFFSTTTVTAQIKIIKLQVTNPTATERAAENVVVSIADLKRIAPDFVPNAVVVTTSDAATLEEDARTIQTVELPSQADDTDDDGKLDELAFQIPLKPNQTRIVNLAYADYAFISRIRQNYPLRTNAKFAVKYEGMGWESDTVAWRLYFDQRNAIDIFGKRRPGLHLETFAQPEYDYHAETPIGRDIYKNGAAIGVGSVGAFLNGKAIGVSDVAERKWRILTTGAVRSIVELTYTGWKIGGKSVDLTSRFTVWAGERGFTHQITAKNADGIAFVTGVPRKAATEIIRSSENSNAFGFGTFGKQVLEPGATATESLANENLGLALIVERANQSAVIENEAANHLLRLPLTNGAARWYVAAVWDQENTENLVGYANQKERRMDGSRVLAAKNVSTRSEFEKYLKNETAKMANPARIEILSKQAGEQSAPPDTLNPAKRKTYAEALKLVQDSIERTAVKWESKAKNASANGERRNRKIGFFTEGDNQTGEWTEENRGYFWTGSFWVGQLWLMYERTKDERYRRWAELWQEKLAGDELTQDHDAGFLYYYSSVFAYRLTKDEKYKQSALLAAERLKQLYNPNTELIAAWEVNGDDSIIDTMLNLQIWWWASKETKNRNWQTLGINHALKSSEFLLRRDGSAIQSVHYNPGDNRQEFPFHHGLKITVPNNAKSGERVFYHTHQGFGADSAWARGTAWALYGYAVAFDETKDARLLATAEKTAAYVLKHLPADSVTWYDFNDQGVHFRNRDTSAAALIAGGLLRLSESVKDKQKAALYRREGERIMSSLIDRYLTPVSTNDKTPAGVLRHGSSTRPQDGRIIYGDYYLLETLLWLDKRKIERKDN